VAVLLVTTLAVVVTAAAITVQSRPEGRIDAVITFGVLASLEVSVLVWFTGVVGVLGAGALAIGAVLIGAIAIARLVHVDREWARRTWDRRRAVLAALRSLPAAARRHPWTAALVALAALAVAWQVVVAVMLPPYAYDALNYHLTTAASWVQSGHLAPVDLSLCCSRYPMTPELSFAWPMALAGNDSAVSLVQVPFVLLLATATAGLVRSAGARHSDALAGAALVATTPIVLVQAPTGFVDVILAAWAVAGLHWLVRAAATGAVRPLVLTSVTAGLLLGSKGIGLVWGLALVAGASVVVLARARRSSRTAMVRRLGVVVLPALVLGSYWYARNWIDTGNPFEPFRVEVAGKVLFDGPVTFTGVTARPPAGAGSPWPVAVGHSWMADVTFWHQGSYDYQQRSGGLGPAWSLLGLPLLVILTVRLARQRSAALVAVAVTGAVFLVQPLRWWSRFTIPLMALGAVAIVTTAAVSRPGWRRAIHVAALCLATIGVALSSFEVDPASRASPLSARRVVALIGAPRSERTVGVLFFPEYRAVDGIPSDATVDVDLGAPEVRFVYPLFGPHLDRRVRPVIADRPPRADAWLVTADGRPVDEATAAAGNHVLVADVDGVRVWRPG
jgi:hypothetical protein